MLKNIATLDPRKLRIAGEKRKGGNWVYHLLYGLHCPQYVQMNMSLVEATTLAKSLKLTRALIMLKIAEIALKEQNKCIKKS